jgi:hypothetical protein
MMNSEILFYAFRYALGRSTYAVNTVVNEIIKTWEVTPRYTQLQFKSEIETAIRSDRSGMQMDVSEWQRVLDLEVSDG